MVAHPAVSRILDAGPVEALERFVALIHEILPGDLTILDIEAADTKLQANALALPDGLVDLSEYLAVHQLNSLRIRLAYLTNARIV